MVNEKRLIDANAADVGEINCYYGGNCRIEDVEEWLNEQPALDAVEVVRCQNCGWWHRFKSPGARSGVCDKYAVSKSENGYCDDPLLEERK